MRSILLAVTLAALAVMPVHAQEEVATTMAPPQLHVLWTDVTTAQTEEEQLSAIEAFVSALPRAGGLPADYALTARDRQGNPVDFTAPGLMGSPREHIVTLHAEGQTFDYRPFSARNLVILLRE